MAKVSTNISLDADLKKKSQELFQDLGMDLTTAITVFLKQSLRVQGFPFAVTRDIPNAETIEAMNEFYTMKAHPEKYKKHSSFKEAIECSGQVKRATPGSDRKGQFEAGKKGQSEEKGHYYGS